jgi:phenylacetate-CoA ligase
MYNYYNKAAETMPRDKLRELQGQRLQATIKRVYENNPVYRKKLDAKGIKPEDIRSVDDLKRLPFTYKQDLRDNYPFGLFSAPMDEVVRIHASS